MNFCEDETLNNVFISSPLFQSNSFRDYPLFILFFSPDSILIEKKKKKKLTFPRARERRITDLGAEVYFSLWAR